MLTPRDIEFIEAQGINISTIEEQINQFKTGFPFVKIVGPATIERGIDKFDKSELKTYINFFDESIEKGEKVLKFVPASGAATRMFKALFEAKSKLEKGAPEKQILENKDVLEFLENIKNFAFLGNLKKIIDKPIHEYPLLELINMVLVEEGLSYGNLPKGLLKFHEYKEYTRTPFQEHFLEGISYAQDKNKTVRMHFTVSPEHQELFEKHYQNFREVYEEEYDVKTEVSFSQQKSSTDTIAVNLDNEPFRTADGSLFFRPGGHGALIENLNELDADLIFIKNIDNVVPDHLKDETIKYKKALGGYLLKIQEKLFYYQHIFDEYHYYALDSKFFSEAVNFLENVLRTKPPTDQYYSEKEEIYHYLKSKFNRPLRVCGMVKK